MSGSETPRRSSLSRRTLLAGTAAAVPFLGVPSVASATVSPSAYPVYDIKADFGAKGNGTDNDTTAFQQAAEAIIAAGGGTLNIPEGTYIVGRQKHVAGQCPYWQYEPIFALGRGDVKANPDCCQPRCSKVPPANPGVAFLHIKGIGARPTLKVADGMRFGSFDPTTGQPAAPPSDDWDQRYGVHVGRLIQVFNGQNITIENLELHGSQNALILGEPWGDTGYQGDATGIGLFGCTNVVVKDVYTHRHGKDGVTIGWGGLTDDGTMTPHSLTNVISKFNGRQALSWVGGRGLTCTDCQFNDTGTLRISSIPRAGIDIEPGRGNSICREGRFIRCQLINNAGWGLNATAGALAKDVIFDDCTFRSVRSRTMMLAKSPATANDPEVPKPGFVFKNSRFHGMCNMGYGSDNPADATRFENCTFSDDQYTHGSYLIDDSRDNARNVKFTDCDFIANGVRSVYTGPPDEDGPRPHKIFDSCTFHHAHSGLGANKAQGVFHDCTLNECTFSEGANMGTTAQWFLDVNDVTVQTALTVGPSIGWNSVGGLHEVPAGYYD